MTPKQVEIYELLLKNESLTAKEMTIILFNENVYQSAVFSNLQKMEELGLIVRDSLKKRTRWSVVNRDAVFQTKKIISNKPSISTTVEKSRVAKKQKKPIRNSIVFDKTVVLIACAAAKRGSSGDSFPARLLYDKSPFFTTSLTYAEIIADDVYVISAKHHLISLNSIIEWYDKTLNSMTKDEVTAWGESIVKQLSDRYNFNTTEFVILAGKTYYTPLIKLLPKLSVSLPLKNAVGFSGQLTTRKHLLVCAKLHRLFNDLPRYQWDTIDKVSFDNGIYIVFEKGEYYYGMDRIVRVGTHTSDRRLQKRLKDHFISKNKDGSIFRKNIGKALLNESNHPYLTVWSMDSSDKQNVIDKVGDSFNLVTQKSIEEEVSSYIQSNISFTCFHVPHKEDRERFENAIIASLNNSLDFHSTNKWKGVYSPEKEIAESGLWLKKGLNEPLLSESEYNKIYELCLPYI